MAMAATLADYLVDYFEYLDNLRESGKTNMMFGAAPYLANHFHLEIKEARSILAKWQNTFDPRKSPDDRAIEALRAND
jgi:hypothetical protein